LSLGPIVSGSDTIHTERLEFSHTTFLVNFSRFVRDSIARFHVLVVIFPPVTKRY
jgi:hypothetical protein